MIKSVVTLAAGLSLALGAPASAKTAPAAGGLLAPIHKFIDSFNKGDIKAAEATHVAAPSIIDEVPPHHWQGDGAFQAWAASLEKDGKAKDQTDQKVTLGPAVRTEVNGDDGYAVVRATFTYKEHGKPMIEPAQFAFSLRKDGGAWKISGWAWTGTKPRAVGAAPAPAAGAAPASPAPAAKPKT